VIDSMNDLLHRARVMRLFAVAGGTLLGEVALAGFKADGDSAHSRLKDAVLGDQAAGATWCELVDEGGDIVAVGPLETRSAGKDD
jgi:hypothetical protein